MAIKFGEIDVSQILENEFRINVLERKIEWIINHNALRIQPSEQDMREIKREVVKVLQKKYPNSGIELKEEEQQPVAG